MGQTSSGGKHRTKLYFLMFVNIWTPGWYLHTLDDIFSVVWQILLPNTFTTQKKCKICHIFPERWPTWWAYIAY